jgi:heme oxygenase
MRAETNPGTTLTSFSAEIRAASWALHRDAESSRYMDELLAGRSGRERYADLVVQHYFIYQVLEDAARTMASDPLAAPFVRDELNRGLTLEADLYFLLGDDWRTKVTPTSATKAYCDRMRDVCFDWPGGFVAHHYVRYMGDLSGGQAVRRTIERSYGVSRGEGAAFYSFDKIADLDQFKNRYRQLLDDAPWEADERARIIDEVLVAYRLNTQLLNEL